MTIDCAKINVKKGSSGEPVKQIQEKLTQYGYYTGKIDGSYGDMTMASVKQFQKDCGLTVDGWVGTETCKKINILQTINTSLKKGSTGIYVRIVQQKLKTLGYHTSSVDGEYGDKTVASVKSYQTSKKLLVDGIVGNITYNHILNETKKASGSSSSSSTTPNHSSLNYSLFTNGHLCEKSGGNCLGQITGFHCGPHCIKQCLRRFGITGYSESTIGGYAGTTSAGTGHAGLETAIATIARKEGITLKVEWKNFSDLGSTQKERYKKYGDLMTDSNKAVFHHELYRNQFGHYSVLKQVNVNNSSLIVANSLGSKCSSPAYCGYMENRGFGTQQSYLSGISQKSICIITKV